MYSMRRIKVNGGLGDRLGGLITAMAFALRTNRIFLIHGDKSFEESFRPYARPQAIESISEQLGRVQDGILLSTRI